MKEEATAHYVEPPDIFSIVPAAEGSLTDGELQEFLKPSTDDHRETGQQADYNEKEHTS